ncbi:MAG: AI-2E family transporter [Candidatus Eremiobacteraeota bacterium]|nr:AI-2E family transporter [Candidatus Eremiobacteraeota bacterium]
MQGALNQRTVRRILGTAWGLLLLALALWLSTRIPRTVSVFLTAAVIALGVHPVTKMLEKRMSRPLAIAIVYLLLLGATVVVALLVVPTAVGQTAVVIGDLPDRLQAFERWANGMQGTIDARFGKGALPLGITDIRAAISERVSAWGALALASLGGMLFGTLTALFVAISAIILSIFFLASGEQIRRQMLSIVPHSREHEVAQVLDEVVHIFGGFVAGQAILCAITGVAIWAFCAILGFKFALLVGVFSGLAYAVPFVGMLVAQVVGAVLAAPQGWGMVWWVTIVIFVISRISDNILVPKIMAPHVGVSPIAVMFGVFAGGELFGLPGLVLGIPAAAMAKVLWRIFVRPWLSRHDIGPRPAEMRAEQLAPGEREIEIEIHETVIERPA